VEFGNGVIEVDLACKPGRVFPGITFRQIDESNYEEFYIRPHKSGQPDALQYTPVFNSLSAWQLYYGEGFTGTWTFPMNKWIHIKMEIKGTQARIYIGEAKNPALVINELKHGSIKGSIGLKVTGPVGLTYFSDFKYRHDESLQFEPPPTTETPYGMITEWEISQGIKFNLIDLKNYPLQQQMNEIEWKKIKSEPNGLINISRYVKKGPVVPDCVLARTAIQSHVERSLPLQFGYSDIVGIFLNGQALFYGRNLFRLRDPFFQGYVGLFDTVYLPLKGGKNELLLILAESMGGWGFMGRVGDAVYLHETMTKQWEISHEFSYPETVVYDKNRDILYASNFYSDTIQYISKVDLEGNIVEMEWIKGLIQPTGMAIDGDTLFVVERRNLVEIDIPSGEMKRYPIPSPGFPNDIAIDEDRNVYITDGQARQIKKFSNNEFSIWKSGFAQVNGIHYFKGKLFVGVGGDSTVKSIDLITGEIKTVAELDPGAVIDGMESDEEGNLLVSDYNGKVYLIKTSGEKILLMDSTAPSQYCANFAYIPGKNLLVIPTLNDNRIIAYRLK
jgi:DNA-binding beta-propeller fold protein YncE